MQHHALLDLLNEKLASVATDIQAIEELINSEPQTTDQILALRTIQELYRRLADDLRIALPLRVAHAGAKAYMIDRSGTKRGPSESSFLETNSSSFFVNQILVAKSRLNSTEYFPTLSIICSAEPIALVAFTFTWSLSSNATSSVILPSKRLRYDIRP
jgi:hypothetical protein